MEGVPQKYRSQQALDQHEKWRATRRITCLQDNLAAGRGSPLWTVYPTEHAIQGPSAPAAGLTVANGSARISAAFIS